MKIDLSAIAIVLLFVAPGYLAYRVRNRFAPRQLSPKGATEEFAGFVLVSAFTQSLIGVAAILGAALLGLASHRDIGYWFAEADKAGLQPWIQSHNSATVALTVLFFLGSCGVGAALGLPLALLNLKWDEDIWQWLLRSKAGPWLKRQGIRGLIGEQPLIYAALNPGFHLNSPIQVFVEAELRDGKGFYIGQVQTWSISRDEDQHKLILLVEAKYSADAESDYLAVEADSVLLDLADVLVLKIKRVPGMETVAPGIGDGTPEQASIL